MLKIENLSSDINQKNILDKINFSLNEKKWLMIVGPNGAGKSSILNAIMQNINYSGNIYFNDTNVKQFKTKEFARNIGILMQNHFVNYSFSIEEIVRLGRYSHKEGFFLDSTDDNDTKILEALEKTGLLSLKERSVLSLSGGELQRVFLAQLLAQDPKIMLLDEPANHLDLIYQKQIFDIIKLWVNRKNRAVISVVHDLSMAKYFGTDILLLDKGSIKAFGKKEEVLTAKNLQEVYSIDVYDWMNSMLSVWQR